MKTVAITFGCDRFKRSRERHAAELRSLGIFDAVYVVTPDDFNKTFFLRHKEFMESSKGYGYWIWKPYVILSGLNAIDWGDVLVYGDAGCVACGPAANFKVCIDEVLQSTLPIGGVQSNRIGVHCKRDVYDRLEVSAETFRYMPLIQAGRLILQKTPDVVKLIEEWMQLSLDYRNIDDSKSEQVELSEYESHRHDQAIFSILWNKAGGDCILDMDKIWPAMRLTDSKMESMKN